MTLSSRSFGFVNSDERNPAKVAKRRRDRLKHIHPITREQQLALIEEARAARMQVQFDLAKAIRIDDLAS